MTEQQQPAGQLEYRAATQIGVSFPHRTIELVVMPYEEETLTEYKGRNYILLERVVVVPDVAQQF